MASAKGHEFFMRHYLDANSNAVAREQAEGKVEEVVWRPEAPKGKIDLVVDLNFRMDTSALYSDIVLPAATWYEKNDLNTTDLHSYVHNLGEAVPPCWESKSDWEIFKAIAKKVSELAQTHLPDPVKDLVCTPLAHDTPDEIAQPEIREWAKGECAPIPGKTMPWMSVVERDYANLYNRFISLGPTVRAAGIGAHGIRWKVDDLYDQMLAQSPTVEWDGRRYPSLSEVVDAANAILLLAPETNGEVAYRAFKEEEAKVGLPLTDLAEKYRGVRYSFADLVDQPRRFLTSPCWSGIVNDGRAYTGFALNVDRLVPWRTLTGRQQFYLDHDWFLEVGEEFCTHKEPTLAGGPYPLRLTGGHTRWSQHSIFRANQVLLRLQRGQPVAYLGVSDARSRGIDDGDWIRVYNDVGEFRVRAKVSPSVQPGEIICYHAWEGYQFPGGHTQNAVTASPLKPNNMVGGYAHLHYRSAYLSMNHVPKEAAVEVEKCREPV